MKKRHLGVVAATAFATAFATTAIVAPAPVEAQQVNVESIVISVGEEHVVVSLLEYAMAVGGADPTLYSYLKDGGNAPAVKGVYLNDKLVDLLQYAMAVGQNKTPAEAYAQLDDISLGNLVEYKGFSNGSAITMPITGSFEVIGIE